MKQTKITDYFSPIQIIKKVYGFNAKTNSWHCTRCGVDLGSMNPRQLCGKIYCFNS